MRQTLKDSETLGSGDQDQQISMFLHEKSKWGRLPQEIHFSGARLGTHKPTKVPPPLGSLVAVKDKKDKQGLVPAEIKVRDDSVTARTEKGQ